MKTQAIYDCFVGARGAAGFGCHSERSRRVDSSALALSRSDIRLGCKTFPRCGHERAFTYNYVKSQPAKRPKALEHAAPHDLSASQSEAARSECVVPEAAPALGSSSFITDATGYATQHLQYLPFGETFVDQQNGYDARYTFSAKEKDDETQYSYFGARYYDSDLSVWLSVDPMSDKRSWISPYNYCQWNPVGRVDPTGALDWHPNKNGDIVADAGDNAVTLMEYLSYTSETPVSYETAFKLFNTLYRGNGIGVDKIQGNIIYYRDVRRIAGSHVASMINIIANSVRNGRSDFLNSLPGVKILKIIHKYVKERLGLNNTSQRGNDYYPEKSPESANDQYGNTNPDFSDRKYNGSRDFDYFDSAGTQNKQDTEAKGDSIDIHWRNMSEDGQRVKSEGTRREAKDGSGSREL